MKLKQLNRSRLNRASKGGFTLVELLLVLTILAILAAIVLPKMTGTGERARKDATRAQISAFKTALDLFEVDNGHYPKGKDGLNGLVVQPRDAQNWHQYLDAIPKDPWGNPYIYECPGKHMPNSFDISSSGPDGRPGTEDDITNWDNQKK